MPDGPREILFEHRGLRLRVTKSDGITRELPNAFVSIDGGPPIRLDAYRRGMTIGEVKDLARASADAFTAHLERYRSEHPAR